MLMPCCAGTDPNDPTDPAVTTDPLPLTTAIPHIGLQLYVSTSYVVRSAITATAEFFVRFRQWCLARTVCLDSMQSADT